MRVDKKEIFRIALPIASLALFYAMLSWFTVKKASISVTSRPILTDSQSQALLAASKAFYAQGNYQQALLRTAILHEAYPDNHLYLESLADIYDRLGDYRHEAQCWEWYMDHAPQPQLACPRIGDAYWKQGKAGEKKALDAYERCVKIEPGNPDSYFYFAHALEKAGEWDRAAQIYEKGISVSPPYVDLHLGLARVWVQQGKLEDAERTGREILGTNPNNVDALFVMGLAFYRQGNLEEAKKYLQRGAELSDTYADIHLILGDIAGREGKTSDAIQQYSRVLQLQPSNEAIRAKLAALRGGGQ